MNEVRVYFSLRGDFAPDELTEFLGIEPSSVAKAGEKNPERGIPKSSLWHAAGNESVQGAWVDIVELSRKVVTPLIPHQDRIAEAVAKWDLAATFQVVVYFSDDEAVSTPAIGFEPEVIDFLSAVGASIDVDTYLS